MKHIALVWTFAAALAAQQGQAKVVPDPKAGLAEVIAVEEQERDLAKAEKLYREALAGTKLSEEGRRLANERLGRLLQKLGRTEEAKPFLAAAKQGEPIGFDDFGAAPSPQDVEREKALREKARGIIEEIMRQQGSAWMPPLFGIQDPRLAEQLLWIGEAAVPEVIAAMQAELEREKGGRRSQERWSVLTGLAGFLWRTGGTLSAAFLASCAKVDYAPYRAAIVATAFQAQEPAMLAEAARFLDDPDPSDEVVSSLLMKAGNTSENPPLQRRFDPALIVDAALRGPVRGKIRMLRWARYTTGFDAATYQKVLGLVREGLKSTDPELGNVAAGFLLSTVSQASVEGIELLLQELPNMRGTNVSPDQPPQLPSSKPGEKTPMRFTAAEATRLLPAVDTCARTLAGAGATERGKQWLEGRMRDVAGPLDASVVPQVLAWMDLGYYVWYALDNRITTANSKEVFARLDHVPNLRDRQMLLNLLCAVELPADLFPVLRDKADQLRPASGWGSMEPNLLPQFAWLMAKTRDPRAADWIMAQGSPNHVTDPLLELGRHTREENVRAAMREAFGAPIHTDSRTRLLLALLAMHDEPALDLVVQLPTLRAMHPYAKKEVLCTPLEYLLYENPDPPHGFTQEQVIAVIEKIQADPKRGGVSDPRVYTLDAIPDRMLGVLAKLDRTTYGSTGNTTSWCKTAVRRLNKRGGEGPLASWFDDVLTKWDSVADVLEALDTKQIENYRPRLEALLDHTDAGHAMPAAMALLRARPTEDLERMLASKHAGVRKVALESALENGGAIADATLQALLRDKNIWIRLPAAQFAGARVNKETVPDLIALLRDGDQAIRTAASDALTRIRFFHEQQAHWDRVLKGLDASPASAAEKLLLQAKPTAPKDQRLLAITSLGALGTPEALPFLIEWTKDTDAEVAAAAKAAITQIHLNPRR